ncbi:CobW family GTP-binding protein [Streptomyces albus]
MRRINATAGISTSRHAAVDLDTVLGVAAFDLARASTADRRWLEEDSGHWHDPDITSVSVELAGDLDRTALEEWLARLGAARGPDLYRIKGILALAGEDRRCVLQGLHRLHELSEGAPWQRGEPRRSRLVLIGRGLDRAELEAGLRACTTPAPERWPAALPRQALPTALDVPGGPASRCPPAGLPVRRTAPCSAGVLLRGVGPPGDVRVGRRHRVGGGSRCRARRGWLRSRRHRVGFRTRWLRRHRIGLGAGRRSRRGTGLRAGRTRAGAGVGRCGFPVGRSALRVLLVGHGLSAVLRAVSDGSAGHVCAGRAGLRYHPA